MLCPPERQRPEPRSLLPRRHGAEPALFLIVLDEHRGQLSRHPRSPFLPAQLPKQPGGPAPRGPARVSGVTSSIDGHLVRPSQGPL